MSSHLLLLALAAVPLAAQPLGQIAGTVVDDRTGQPLPGAVVQLDYDRKDTSDPSGRFQFPNTPPGDHFLRAEKEGYAKLDAVSFKLAPGENIPSMTLRLAPEAVITGRLLDAQGRPVRGTVNLESAERGTHAASQFTQTGDFRIGGLSAGRYKLFAQGAGITSPTWYPDTPTRDLATVIELAAGERKSGLDVTLVATTTYKVLGRFTGVIPAAPRTIVTYERLSRERTGGTTSAFPDASGNFQLEMPPDDYRLKVMHLPQNGGRPTILGFRDVRVTDAPLDNIIIPASPVRSVRTRFRTPAPSASILFNPTEGLGITQWSKRQPDGSLLTENLTPDRYAILLGGLPAGFYPRAILAAGANITASGFDLITGSATDLEVVLANDGATLTGRVLDSARQPVQAGSVSLQLVSDSRPERELRSCQASLSRTAPFALEAIAPGEYQVIARANGKTSAPQTIRLAPRARQTIEIVLP